MTTALTTGTKVEIKAGFFEGFRGKVSKKQPSTGVNVWMKVTPKGKNYVLWFSRSELTVVED